MFNNKAAISSAAVQEWAFAPRNHAHFPRVHENDFKPVGLQKVGNWNPVHAGAFHRHGFDFPILQPAKHPVQLECRRPEVGNIMATVVAARTADINNDQRDLPGRYQPRCAGSPRMLLLAPFSSSCLFHGVVCTARRTTRSSLTWGRAYA